MVGWREARTQKGEWTSDQSRGHCCHSVTTQTSVSLFLATILPAPRRKMVLLVTSDNEQFHADKEVVERSVLIKNMLEGILSFSYVTPAPLATLL